MPEAYTIFTPTFEGVTRACLTALDGFDEGLKADMQAFAERWNLCGFMGWNIRKAAILNEISDLGLSMRALNAMLEKSEIKKSEIIKMMRIVKRMKNVKYSAIVALFKWVQYCGITQEGRSSPEGLRDYPVSILTPVGHHSVTIETLYNAMKYERVLVPVSHKCVADAVIDAHIESILYLGPGIKRKLGTEVVWQILKYIGLHTIIMPELRKHAGKSSMAWSIFQCLVILDAGEFRGLAPLQRDTEFYKLLKERCIQTHPGYRHLVRCKQEYDSLGPANPRHFPFNVEQKWQPPAEAANVRFAVYLGVNGTMVCSVPVYVIIDYKLQIMYIFRWDNSLIPVPTFWPEELKDALTTLDYSGIGAYSQLCSTKAVKHA